MTKEKMFVKFKKECVELLLKHGAVEVYNFGENKEADSIAEHMAVGYNMAIRDFAKEIKKNNSSNYFL